jgi:hypothetical protein
MRASLAVLTLLVCSCATPVPLSLPIDVVGDGEHGVVLLQTILVANPDTACRRATDGDEWWRLRVQMGWEVSSLAADYVDFAVEQLVVVPLPIGSQLLGTVVSSEEGVDVVTLDIQRCDQRIPQACLMRLSRRTCQIAIILRDQEAGEERTLAVYSGL